jgi:mRNA interferase RelE/StbE
MAYKLDFTPAALRDVKKLPATIRPGIVASIQALADNPRPQGYEKVQGSDLYRIRQGEYRVIYAILDDVLTVLVVRARHRREVYKSMKGLRDESEMANPGLISRHALGLTGRGRLDARRGDQAPESIIDSIRAFRTGMSFSITPQTSSKST